MLEKGKRKRKLTFKKANLASDDEVDSRDDKEKEKDKEALLCLMALNDEINEVHDSSLSYSSDDDNDIDDLYHELYDSLVIAKKYLKLKVAKNELLIEKLKSCEKENYNLNCLLSNF